MPLEEILAALGNHVFEIDELMTPRILQHLLVVGKLDQRLRILDLFAGLLLAARE